MNIITKKNIMLQIYLFLLICLLNCEDVKYENMQEVLIKDCKITKIAEGNNIYNNIYFDWVKEFNIKDGKVNKLIKANDGGYAIVGEIYNEETIKENIKMKTSYAYASNILVLKTDSNGNKEWLKQINKDVQNIGYDIINSSNKGYFITGGTYDGFSGNDIWNTPNILTVKLNRNGNQKWIKHYVDENVQVKSSFESNNFDYFVLGEKYINREFITFIQRNDSNGNKINEFLFYIKNGFKITKNIKVNTNDYIFMDSGYLSLMKLMIKDSIKINWIKRYMHEENNINEYSLTEISKDIYKTLDNSFIITGSCYVKKNEKSDSSKEKYKGLFIFKTDINGNPIWMRVFYCDKEVELNSLSVVEAKKDEYIIAGSTYSSKERVTKMLLLKVDSEGVFQWVKMYKEDKYSDEELEYLVSVGDKSIIGTGTGFNIKEKSKYLLIGKVNMQIWCEK